MDLGESEVTDRVSWLDQPSLVDTMASTAHSTGPQGGRGRGEDNSVGDT